MPKARAFECGSDSSSCNYGVPDNCGLGACQGPFQDLVDIYSVSSIGCDSSSCPQESSGAFSDLCESDTMSKCPRIEHQVKVCDSSSSSSSSSGRCGRCHYRRCKCNKAQCNFKALLCADESCSDSDSDCSDGAYIAPIPGCNVAIGCGFSDCSSESDSDSFEPCDKKKRVKVETCVKCLYPVGPKGCKCGAGIDIKIKVDVRVFNVSFVVKRGHPWEKRICIQQGNKIIAKPHCIAIDGVAGKDLHLTRGHTYEFNVIQIKGVNYTLFFTRDPLGGPQGHACADRGYVAGVLKECPTVCTGGTVKFTISSSCPKQFYYQCREVPCMGGIVYVHDK